MLEAINIIIKESLQSINAERVEKSPIVISDDTYLFGKKGELDSLELVSLVVDVEERIQDDFGAEISLTNDEVLKQEPSPFVSVSALSSYIENLLK